MPRLTRRAEKDLDRLPERLASKAREIIRRLDDEPMIGNKLKGALRGRRAARLGRSHRILYTATGGEVVVLAITARKDAYRS